MSEQGKDSGAPPIAQDGAAGRVYSFTKTDSWLVEDFLPFENLS